MNKTRKLGGATLYGRDDKFQTYELGYGQVQIRDNRPDASRKPEIHGIVMVFPTMGGGFSTYQGHKQAKKLARKVVRLLNNE